MVSGPWSMIRCLIEAWRLGVTDRQDDQSASHAALDFIRSREVDRFADYMRRGLSAARISKPKFRVLAELGHSIFQIGTERFIWWVLSPSAFGDPISESQATDRSTFCPMPGGRSQAASDSPLRPFCSDARGGALGQSAWNECRWGYLVMHRMPMPP